ncbi:sulfotransferase [Qipengyuania sp. DSG2-2]|uniref:sulfotransferase family protein n=1 Tax=Qipengyuania sp. DGS2-2 TaxID=3349631 RepID=UPI0036D2986A
MSTSPSPNCPQFLIIGAMKAGTTTLYRDLELHPQVFLPQEKEPETLVSMGDDHEAILRDYASLFRGAREGQIRGEASTAYTKRPTFEGAADRAKALCGPDLKLIYLMREPVGRMVSQYRHEFGLHETDLSMDTAFAQDSRYADYSRYDYQLEPWQAAFPACQILLLSFEEYVQDRAATLLVVCQFLGIDPALLPQPEEDKAFNASEGKPVARGLIGRFVTSRLYQRGIKQAVPRALRERAMQALLPKARSASGKLDPQMRATLAEQFAPYTINKPALPPDH